MLPRGHYTSYVYRDRRHARRGQSVAFDMDAFVIKLERHDPGARPVDHGHGHLGRAAVQESRALYIYQPGHRALERQR